MLHMLCEADEVSPICSIILFFQMTLKPTVCIRSVKEVDLTPLQGPSRAYRSTLSIRLHAPHIAGMDDIVLGAVARLAGQCHRGDS